MCSVSAVLYSKRTYFQNALTFTRRQAEDAFYDKFVNSCKYCRVIAHVIHWFEAGWLIGWVWTWSTAVWNALLVVQPLAKSLHLLTALFQYLQNEADCVVLFAYLFKTPLTETIRQGTAILFSHLRLQLIFFHIFSPPPAIFWFPFSFFVFHPLFFSFLFLILLSSTSTSPFPSLLYCPLLPFSPFPRYLFCPSSCPDLRSCTFGVKATCRASVYLSVCLQARWWVYRSLAGPA